MRSQKTTAQPDSVSIWLLVALGCIGILGPLGTDALAPALPSIVTNLDASVGSVQASLGLFGIGMALGQLIIGPLSDRLGRQKFLIYGALVMALGSFISACAHGPVMLNLGCLVMGLGGAVSVVVVWAVVADHTRGKESARGLAIVDMFVSIGPIIGPLGGVTILYFSDWRGIFVAVGIFALVCSGISIFFVRESLNREVNDRDSVLQSFRSYASVFLNQTFRYRLVSLLASFAVLFAYIGASPFLLMQTMGLTTLEYSALFAANGLGIVVAGAITAWLSRRRPIHEILRLGILLQATSSIVLLALVLMNELNIVVVAPILFILVGSFGLIFGPGTALAIEDLRTQAGSALAVLGALQFLVGGLVIMLISLGDAGVMLAVTVTSVTLISLAAYVRLSLRTRASA